MDNKNNNNKNKNLKNSKILKENESINSKQFKTFTKNLYNISINNNNNKNKELKMPGIQNDQINQPPYTATNFSNFRIKNESLDFSNKEHLKEFIANKKKINSRLNSMYRESIENLNVLSKNNSVGQRILIKNSQGNNIEERFMKTTKNFY